MPKCIENVKWVCQTVILQPNSSNFTKIGWYLKANTAEYCRIQQITAEYQVNTTDYQVNTTEYQVNTAEYHRLPSEYYKIPHNTLENGK